MTLGNMRENGVRARSTDHMLTLKRASKYTGGPWDNDDYGVFDGERQIGRRGINFTITFLNGRSIPTGCPSPPGGGSNIRLGAWRPGFTFY